MTNGGAEGEMELRSVTDSMLLQQWLEGCIEFEHFWDSKPRWAPSSGRRLVSDELVVWSERSLFSVSPAAAAVAIHFDGNLTLAALVDDVVAAVDAPVAAAQRLVATVSLELYGRGAVLGMSVPAPPQAAGPKDSMSEAEKESRPEVGEFLRVDPTTGAEHRVVTEMGPTGDVMTTEFLPDGRRIVTTTLTIGGDDRNALEAVQAITGDRSLAELVPPDSCLGSKLRNDEETPLVTIRCADDRLRSVRCHDPEVAEALRARAGELLERDGSRGPIEVFVVTPLEGDGPARIYDGHGGRRGRPRTVGQAVDVVDQILGERTVEESGDARRTNLLTLPFLLIGGPNDEGFLVPPDALEVPGLVANLLRHGWTPTWGDAEVTSDGVRAPSALGGAAAAAPHVTVLLPGVESVEPAQRSLMLLEPLVRKLASDEEKPHAIDRGRLLDLAVGLVETAEWRSIMEPLDEYLLVRAGPAPSTSR